LELKAGVFQPLLWDQKKQLVMTRNEKWLNKYGDSFLDKIEAWKEKHGGVHYVKTENGYEAFLKKPSRQIVNLAMVKGREDPLGLIEVVLENTWLEGDSIIKTDTGLMMSLGDQVDKIIGVVKVIVERHQTDEGDFYKVETENGYTAFLKPPSRQIIKTAMTQSRQTPLKLVEVILQDVWLKGDEIIKNDVGLLVSLMAEINEIIGTKNVELEEL